MTNINFNFKASDVAKHSAAHVLATAVKRIFPNVRIGVGPVTKNGFYYDFETDRELTEDDLPLIEKNINQILQENLPFTRLLLTRNEGYNLLLQIGQIYKAELIKSIPDEQVSFYKVGDEFIDLCRGPHVKSTNQIGIIKLMGLEASNWKDDGNRPPMQRIHGVVFQNIVEYNEFTEAIKSRETRDFIKISQKNNLGFLDNKKNFYFTEKGYVIINNIEALISKEMLFMDFKQVENTQFESTESVSKLLDKAFKNINRSYKSLPFVYGLENTSKVHVDENIQMLDKNLIFKAYLDPMNGNMFIGDFIEKLLYINKFFAKDDINVEIRCSNLENSIVKIVSNLLQKKIISHNKILSSSVGHKIILDFKTTDSVGKTWSLCSMTIYLDSSKTRFYTSKNYTEIALAFMVAFPINSIFGYLIEENDINIPFELKLYQITCIPKSNKQYNFALKIASSFRKYGFNIYCDLRSESFKSKIRDAERNKSEFIFILGKKEELNNAVSVRHNQLEVGLVSMDNILNFISENKR